LTLSALSRTVPSHKRNVFVQINPTPWLKDQGEPLLLPVPEFHLHLPTVNKEEEGATGGADAQAAAPWPGRYFSALFHLRALEAFRYREFRLIWYGQIFVSMGTWMDEVTRGWLIYELTNSAFHLGLVRGVQAIPFLLLSPLAGSAADRYSRKTQLVAAQAANGVVYGVTALLILTHQIRPWHVYVTAFLMAAVQTFQQPARAAMICDAVPPGGLTNAIGLNAIIFNLARSTGPALAGMLIAVFGTGGTYAVQALFFLLATCWTMQLRPVQCTAANTVGQAANGESFGRSIIEGWKFSWKNEAVRTGLLCTMLASLFIVPFMTLLPVFARDLLRVGAEGQGLLLTAMGIGALLSAVLIASAGDRLPRGMLMMGSVALYGLILLVFAASRWFGLSLLLMGIAGLCHVHSNALVQTVIQSYSPSEFRGRTMAIFNMNRVLIMAGSMFIGALSSLWGARWAVALMGAVGALAMIAMYAVLPRARHIR
jgi:predicted MFS family arabinose efflux permease